MKQKPNNSEIYEPLTLYFRRDNSMQMDAFRFLSLVGRSKTILITKLINQYLKKNGIHNVIKISKEEANSLISNADTFNEPQQMSGHSSNPEIFINLLQELVNNQNAVKQVTEQTPEMAQPDDHPQEKINKGRFGSRNTVQEQPISSPTAPEEKNVPAKEPIEPIMDEPEENYPDSEEESAALMPNWAKGLDMFSM